MKYLYPRKQSVSCMWLFLFCTFLFLLMACGKGTNISQNSSENTCRITFKLIWPDFPGENTSHRLRINCEASGISIIKADVYRESNELLKQAGPWSCDAHEGEITNVPPGGHGIVNIQGIDPNENIIYWGNSSVISLVPGEVYAGAIDTYYSIPELLIPADNSNATPDGLEFRWSDITCVSEYRIQVSEDDEFKSILIDTNILKDANSTYPSYIPTENLNTGTCYWRVRAKDNHGNKGGWSNVYCVTIELTSDVTPPPAPIDLTVTPSSWTGINSFRIDWTNPYDQSGIAGAYYKLGSAPVSQADAKYTQEKPFTVSAAAEGGQAIYVWLKDRADNTNPNNYSLATLLYDATPPVDGNISVMAGDRQISLNWSGFSDTASGIKQYVISCGTSNYPASCDDPNAILYLGANTYYSHPNLENGTIYYYRICAIDNTNKISDGVTAYGTPQAPHYYVDANNGNNITGEGTQASPWMTISYALSQVTGSSATIHVAAGTYDTNIDETWSEIFPIQLKDGVSLKGESRDTTIIDAGKTNIIMTGTDIGSDTTVEGFTFKNGKYFRSSASGGITLTNSSPAIQDNIFENNEGGAEGGAISVFGDSSPHILYNIFRNNISEQKGTIYIDSGSPMIGENLFTGNSGEINSVETVIYIESGTALIRNNLFFHNNTYAGITIAGGSDTCIMNNTIVGASYSVYGSGIIISGGTETRIVNNIIADHTGYGIEEKDASYDPNRVEYNLFYNNHSGHYLDEGIFTYPTILQMNSMIPECVNNLEADPLFFDPAYGDYHLQSGSPSINAGTNDNAPDVDIDGDIRPQSGIVDIGADELEFTPPQNIITFPGNGRITLIWEAVSEATHYNIYMAEFQGISKTNYSEKKTVKTAYYQWIELGNGTTYYFMLTSENDYEESTDSNVILSTPTSEINHYIFPDSGLGSTNTPVTIIGEGFQETPTVSLYGGKAYITGSCKTPGYARGVSASGSYAYVADGGSGFHVIDITDSENPEIVGSCDMPDYSWNVYFSGACAYVADGSSGLQVVDISDPGNPNILASCDTPASARGAFVSGAFAYVADYTSGLQVIDIGDPNNPNILASCDTPGSAWDIFVLNSYAYVADGHSGLQVIDISDPNNPIILASCDTPDNAIDIYVTGSYAYIADLGSGLLVIDISNPANPSIVGSCDTPGSADSIFVSGSYAYVADKDSGLLVIDITDPGNLSIVGSCNTPDSAIDIYVTGSYAYVADYGSGIHIIEKFKPLADITYLDTYIIKATVPSGFRPGTYNLNITNTDGGHMVFPNIFTVFNLI